MSISPIELAKRIRLLHQSWQPIYHNHAPIYGNKTPIHISVASALQYILDIDPVLYEKIEKGVTRGAKASEIATIEMALDYAGDLCPEEYKPVIEFLKAVIPAILIP